jgi:uncharacterized membrane protein
MTDDTKTPANDDTVAGEAVVADDDAVAGEAVAAAPDAVAGVAAEADDTGASVVGAEADDTGATVVGAVADPDGNIVGAGAVATDYDNVVAVAAFADEDAAYTAYGALQDAETSGQLPIEGVLVIKTDENGKVKIQKMTDHSTKTGVKWGAVGGVILGIFFPPTLIAGAVGGGILGGVLGKVRNEWHKSEVGDSLAGALGPNESGILVLAKAADIAAVQATMPQATKVRTAGVDDATAAQITDAAKKAS